MAILIHIMQIVLGLKLGRQIQQCHLAVGTHIRKVSVRFGLCRFFLEKIPNQSKPKLKNTKPKPFQTTSDNDETG